MSSEASDGAIRQLLAVFGFGIDESGLKKGKSALNEFVEHVKHVGEAVAAAFAVDAIFEFAESQAHAMNAIERTSAQLGISTDRVQEFQFAAKSLGLEVESLLNSMGRLQVSQQMAAQGSGMQAKAFHDLGVSVRDSNGHMKNADDLMLDVADGISKTADPSKRAAAAVSIFGREGRQLLPFLEQGRKGAEEYFKTFKELGGGYTEDSMRAAKDFEKQQAKTNLVLTALKNTIAKALLPIITSLASGLQRAAKWVHEVTKDSHLLQAALITLAAFAAPFAVSMAVAAAPLLLIAAAIAAVILAVDDLYTFLTGGDSAIGELLDKIFGKGAQTEVLAKVKDAWADIKDTFVALKPVLADVWDFVKKIVEGLREIPQLRKELKDWFNREDPSALLGERSKGALTPEQREAVHRRATLRNEQMFNAGTALPTGYFGPLNVPSSNHVKVDVHVPPGLNEKQVGEHVARQVGEVMKQERRAAAATLPRSGN